jgi:hypothetical protein
LLSSSGGHTSSRGNGCLSGPARSLFSPLSGCTTENLGHTGPSRANQQLMFSYEAQLAIRRSPNNRCSPIHPHTLGGQRSWRAKLPGGPARRSSPSHASHRGSFIHQGPPGATKLGPCQTGLLLTIESSTTLGVAARSRLAISRKRGPADDTSPDQVEFAPNRTRTLSAGRRAGRFTR